MADPEAKATPNRVLQNKITKADNCEAAKMKALVENLKAKGVQTIPIASPTPFATPSAKPKDSLPEIKATSR